MGGGPYLNHHYWGECSKRGQLNEGDSNSSRAGGEDGVREKDGERTEIFDKSKEL